MYIMIILLAKFIKICKYTNTKVTEVKIKIIKL